MKTFKVEASREVTVTERTSFEVEAESQAEADKAAAEHMAHYNRRSEPELEWTENLADAVIGEAKVKSVTLHAFDPDEVVAEGV